MSCSFDLDDLWDSRLVALQLLFCGVLLPGFVFKKPLAFLCSSHLTFSQSVSLEFRWWNHTVVLKRPQLEKSRFILIEWSYFHTFTSLSIAVHVFFIRDVFLWTLTHRCSSFGRPTKAFTNMMHFGKPSWSEGR